MIMFPLLICIYDPNAKYTTVKPCKLLLLLRPTGRRQPVQRSMKADKVARPNFTTRPESSKGRKYSASGADQPSKATSRSLLHSDISKDKGQRCRTQPGNPARWPQAGLKSLYKSVQWAKSSITLLCPYRTQVAIQGKLLPSE